MTPEEKQLIDNLGERAAALIVELEGKLNEARTEIESLKNRIANGTNISVDMTQKKEQQKNPDFNEWIKTKSGEECSDFNNLSEQKFLTNRLFWAFDAGRNCVWDQLQKAKETISGLEDVIVKMQGENNVLKNDLLDALDLKKGEGPTALSMLKADNDKLREALKRMKT